MSKRMFVRRDGGTDMIATFNLGGTAVGMPRTSLKTGAYWHRPLIRCRMMSDVLPRPNSNDCCNFRVR